MTNKNIVKQTAVFFAFTIILAAAFAVSLFLGTEQLDLSTETGKLILYKLRLPRSALVLISGALLAGTGAMFQLFFRNSLADPGLMGISSGATLGAICFAVFFARFSFLGISILSAGAFLGAICSGLLIAFLSFGKSRNSVTIILCGSAAGTFFSAISSIIQLTHREAIERIFSWLVGSFSGKTFSDLKTLFVPALICFFLLVKGTSSLDLLCGGEESAQSLGLDIRRTRIFVLVTGALGVSCAVCAGGTIGFVGLIAPHIVRRLFSRRAKILVPLSMLLGSIFLLVCDTVARVVVRPSELPVGIITSLVGVPFFISLINARDSNA